MKTETLSKIKGFFKEHWFWLLLISLLTFSLIITLSSNRSSDEMLGEIEYIDKNNTYNKRYYEGKFKELKETNRALYDSLQDYKNEVSYLLQFTHEKRYESGMVKSKPTVKDTTSIDTATMTIPMVAKTYQYKSEPNDTLEYELDVNSYVEPIWYSLRLTARSKFTIVNKEQDGVNHITIESSDKGDISDVTVFKKKDTKKLTDRFTFGPTATFGYDPINGRMGVVVGVGFGIKLN